MFIGWTRTRERDRDRERLMDNNPLFGDISFRAGDIVEEKGIMAEGRHRGTPLVKGKLRGFFGRYPTPTPPATLQPSVTLSGGGGGEVLLPSRFRERKFIADRSGCVY